MKDMGEKYFDLQQHSKIWIYGAGENAQSYCRELMKQGYHVEGFLDRNAKNLITVCDRKVYLPMDAKRVIPKDAVIIISLRNGLQQEAVAEELAGAGFCHLIYLPMHIKQSLDVRKRYRQNYTHLMEYDFAQIKQVPVYEFGKEAFQYVLIEQNAEKVSFWCPVRDLHSGISVADEIKQRWDIDDTLVNQYVDIKIGELRPYVELFQYFRDDKTDVTFYLELQGRKTPEQKKSLLEDRKKLYEVFEQAYKYDMSFFTDSPSLCAWNEKGYFNMYDGLHRAHYLISKGYEEVPISVKREDYEKYILCGEKGCRL